MKQIKFSHEYEKFKGLAVDKPVTLIQVMVTHKEHLSEYFVEYDTKFYTDDGKHNYPLKAQEYLLLFFMDYTGKLFTTLRRVTGWKKKYYQDSVGCQFKLSVAK